MATAVAAAGSSGGLEGLGDGGRRRGTSIAPEQTASDAVADVLHHENDRMVGVAPGTGQPRAERVRPAAASTGSPREGTP